MSQFIVSQTIVGKIQNTLGNPLPFANVMIKDAKTPTLIIEYVITKKTGDYKLVLKNTYPKIIIQVTVNGYFPETYSIENPKKEGSYTHDFVLQDDAVNQLKEVVIKNEKKPFVITKDTIKYNVSAYMDGSERRIEDVIKKLPGVEINDKSGEITYKGKSIETVTLEGDNLFGSNYSIGTKNINVDMVEQVQAIQNYSDNPLLKGIENGDKVSLNLKLKKGKVDFSGSIDVANGIKQDGKGAYDESASIMETTKNFKSFGMISYNNIGKNDTPFDYFSFNENIEQIKENDITAKKYIPEIAFSCALDESRANINNTLFSNYNTIFKIGKRISIKSNLYYVNDKISTNQLSESNNTINNESFITSDSYFIEKKPTQYRGNVDIKANTSKKSLLEYKFKISQENIVTLSNVVQNNNSNYETNLKSENFYLKQALLFTQKFSDKKALQISVNHSTNYIPQNFRIAPSIYYSPNYTKDNQYSNSKKNYLGFESVLLGRANTAKYTFTVGGFLVENPFNSGLRSSNDTSEIPVADFQNDLVYKKSSLYTLGSYNFIYKKLKISPSYSLKYLNQNLENSLENTTKNNNHIIFEPNITVKYGINEVSNITGKIGYNEKSIAEEHLFSNSILVSNRISESNIQNLAIQKALTFATYYTVNDLYKQFQLNLGVNFSQNRGDFFSNINVKENNTQIEYFYLPENYKNLNLNFLIEKYIPVFESTIRLKSNYNYSDYKNIINNSDLRNNTNQYVNSEVFIRTVFDIKINFENVVQYCYNKSQSEENKFINSSLNDTFKIIIKPNKKWFVSFSSDYYLPNTKLKTNYLFLDGSIRFTPKAKFFDFSFVVKNLLNNNNFTQIQTNDYSKTLFQTNLIPRYFILNATYNY
ncbi:hypothetical protein DB895_03875 [Flavobacterium psychrotolerans]|uniref:TonB-dependent receptor n=1 Tax=Flavobacterium psychrotolerans TaxID=2169410 RepID=A0A2U1JNU8_9FLAO|nr:hypothetical protein DB895_03875 [Flavobacterium psychrotolerans]